MLDADIQLYSHNIYHRLNAISEPASNCEIWDSGVNSDDR
ncbi:hypothetical protein GQ55_6G000900 [Panicum hallii var. hallii]|uniref:Uncharacterized protein n=1 Tax=Panicum hallii var. hallii TaxID=1504633 RepID=A0A2T7D2A0_9POAL|nr:hypothetical protein GQ55_6G000900 [Panicum hallii var. hallii]